jgi:hypothetical protein
MIGRALLRARITAFAAAVPLLMKLRLEHLDRVVSRRHQGGRSLAELDALSAELDAVLTAPRRPVRAGCLTRGLTRYFFLRGAGAPVSLCFGMGSPFSAELEGHCWLELDGEPLFETRDPRPLFAEMYRLPR